MSTMRTGFHNLIAFFFAMTAAAVPATDRCILSVSNFETQGLAGWKERRFAGSTLYTMERVDDTVVVRGSSNSSASALYLSMDVDIERFPYLNWGWRVSNVHEISNQGSKSGDDYAARIYVIATSDDNLPIALNYVWSNTDSADMWHNPFSRRSMMFAVVSGSADVGRWRSENVNVRADFKRAFNLDIRRIEAVAIMVDSDNAGGAVTAWFREIYFSAVQPH